MSWDGIKKKQLILTIDDAPSSDFKQKVDLLSDWGIPALFFIRGEFAKNRLNNLVYALKKNFLLGNHSMTHPSFPTLSLDQMQQEIESTESILNQAYEMAKRDRLVKYFRYPFGHMVDELKTYLLEQKLLQVPWTLEIKDYHKRYSDKPEEMVVKLQKDLEASDLKTEIVLMHDFEHNTKCFIPVMEVLRASGEFVAPDVSSQW